MTFVSPNVPGIEKDHNQRVFETYAKALSYGNRGVGADERI